MSLLVTGSIGIDTVETPHGSRADALGGSAIYFAYAASFFTQVRLVGAVGEDFPSAFTQLLEGREIDTRGLEVRKSSKTFRWSGAYQGAMNDAETTHLELNILAEKPPKIPLEYADSQLVFLANTSPALQIALLDDLDAPKLVVADTRDHWIVTEREALDSLLARVDGLVLNDGEATLLSGEHSTTRAARRILEMGPRFVIVKKGEHGGLLAERDGDLFVLPAYPSLEVVDPTGAGDSFAGGMMGYLASSSLDSKDVRRALAYGTVVASIVIEDFSLDSLLRTSREDIDARLDRLAKMMAF